MLLHDFRSILLNQYKEINSAAAVIADSIGKTISLSNDLTRFITVFSNLPTMDQENLFTILSGYSKDADSVSKRDSLISRYKIVVASLEALSKGKNANLFNRLKKAIISTLKSIDDFNDNIVNSLTKIHVDRPDEIAKRVYKQTQEFFGSAESSVGNSFVNFDHMKIKMKYMAAIASIKANLKVTANEMESFSENYESILGEEAGWLIDRIRSEYNWLINFIDPVNSNKADVPSIISIPLQEVAKNLQKEIKDSDNSKNKYNALHALLKKQRNAKVKMIEVAQAIDLYLRGFSNAIARDPDSIKDIVKMLDQVDLVAKWFNDRSGDNLAALFETFPCGLQGHTRLYSSNNKILDDNGKLVTLPIAPDENNQKEYYVWLEKNLRERETNLPGNPTIGIPIDGNKDGKYVKGLLNLSMKTIKSMRALENILSVFASIGNKFGDTNLQSKSFMNPGQIFNGLCEYISASSFTFGFNPYLKQVPPPNGIHRLNTIHSGSINSQKINNNNIPSIKDAKWFRNDKEFANICSTLGNSFVIEATADKAAAIEQNNNMDHEFGIISGVSTGVNDGDTKYTSIAMSSIPGMMAGQVSSWDYHNTINRFPRVDIACWLDNMYDTDNLFVMTVKSIICKIFTVVDAYRLFNQPNANHQSHDSLNPLRSILGGVEGGYKQSVKVIKNAAELYIRLPLLAEWYREIFGFKHHRDVDGNTWILSIVPSIDGIWSDFVSVIFDESGYVSNGNYSESQSQKIIESINKVYKAYKTKYRDYTNRSIINAFVVEMNRIFGFMKQKEINAYFDDRLNNSKSKSGFFNDDDIEDIVDYDILDSNEQFERNPAPSDKFISAQTDRTRKRKQRVMVYLHEEIIKLRTRMDQSFKVVDGADKLSHIVSFSNTINTYKTDIGNAESDQKKYKIVLNMIQNSSQVINISADKLLMLHESVAAPLFALYYLYKVMNSFNSIIHGTSFSNIREWSVTRTRYSPDDNPYGFFEEIANSATAFNDYVIFLKIKYPNSPNDILIDFGNALVPDDGASFLSDFTEDSFIANDNSSGSKVPRPINDDDELNSVNLFMVAWDKILLCQLSALIDLSANSNKLITVNIHNNSINVDFSHMEEIATELLDLVKSNINNLRIDFTNNASLLAKYEDNSTIGSISWLQEKFIDNLIKNKYGTGLDVGISEHLHSTIRSASIPPSRRKRDYNGGIALAVFGGHANAGAIKSDIVSITEDILSGGTGMSMANVFNALIFWGEDFHNTNPGGPSKFCDLGTNVYNYYINDGKTFPFDIFPLLKKPNTINNNEKQVISDVISNSNDDTYSFPNPNNTNLANKLFSVPILFMTGNSVNLANPNANFIGKSNHLNEWNFFPHNKSLLIQFNDLLCKYLYHNMEETTKKIYIPLFESFINSAASSEVLQGKAIRNVAPFVNAAFNNNQPRTYVAKEFIGSPPNNTIMLYSNALIMKTFISQIDEVLKKSRHKYESLSDVPEYMKERMVTNLPYYSKLFGLIYFRTDLIRQLLNETSLKNNIKQTFNGLRLANIYPNGANWGHVGSELININEYSSSKSLNYFNGLLNKLALSSHSIKQCTDNVYKELNDVSPYFMNIRKDFIKDFKQRNGVYPVMPGSNMLLPLNSMNGMMNNWNQNDNLLLLPTKANGSPSYVFNYASRLLLARSDIEPQMNHLPGSIDIYNNYSKSAVNSNHITSTDYNRTILSLVKLARFLDDGASYGRLFALYNGNTLGCRDINRGRSAIRSIYFETSTDLLAEKTKLNNNNFVFSDRFTKSIPYIYQLSGEQANQRIQNVLLITENNNVNTSKTKIVSVLQTDAQTNRNDRSIMRISNILDLNIVPVNVHSFMKEIPFTNILNYSYTFDRMVHEFILPQYATKMLNSNNYNQLMIQQDDNSDNTRLLMTKLLVYPYANITQNLATEYYALLGSLFNGNDNFKLGRPRYLSDQLWNKVLLTSSVQLVAGQKVDNTAHTNNGIHLSEGGPQAYEAQRAIANFGNIPHGFTKTLKFPELPNTLDVNFNGIVRHININLIRDFILYNKTQPNINSLVDSIDTLLRLRYYSVKTIANLELPIISDAIKIKSDFMRKTFDTMSKIYNTYRSYDSLTNAIVHRGQNNFNDILSHVNPKVTYIPPIDITRLFSSAYTNDHGNKAIHGYNTGNLYTLTDFSFLGFHVPIPNLVNEQAVQVLVGDINFVNNYFLALTLKSIILGEMPPTQGESLETTLIRDSLLFMAGSILANNNDVIKAAGGLLLQTIQNIFKNRASIYRQGNAVYRFFNRILSDLIRNNNLQKLNQNDEDRVLRRLNQKELRDEIIITGSMQGRRLQVLLCGISEYFLENPVTKETIFNDIINLMLMYKAGTIPFILTDLFTGFSETDVHRYVDQPFNISKFPVSTEGLKYFDKTNREWRVSIKNEHNMPAETVIYCADLGIVRFNTKLVRNLTWLTQLQRIMRVVLTDHLDWINSPVVKGLAITNESITEYEGNEQYDKDFYHGLDYQSF